MKNKAEINKTKAGPMKYGAGFHGLKKLKTEMLTGCR